MSRRAAGLVLALALLAVAGGLAWWWQAEHGGRRTRRSGPAAAADSLPTERRGFDLYFPTAGGTLRAEHRELGVSDAPKDRIRKTLEALLAGPQSAGLVRPFPEQVKLGSVQLSDGGTAFVDLRWPEHDEPPASGSTEEIQRIYSIVNSVALNVPQAARVVVLWNGTQRDTFSGHLDTSRPLLPDRTLLAP
ncbi:MAG TPA: GerMN domain-containing protein [Thermoanaerobaculia bacterium]|nr:GerMN domain-containing protein [Thermoanaerobaculia bacterium]